MYESERLPSSLQPWEALKSEAVGAKSVSFTADPNGVRLCLREAT